MATITAVVPSAKREGRFDLLVDGQNFATVSLEAIERLHLHAGAVLTAPDLALVQDEAQTLRTYDRALDLLAVRARASRELRLLLIRKGEPAPNVDIALSRLTAAGFLNDADYARQFARAKVIGPGLSKRRLQSELARRGVQREVADRAIADVMEDEDVDADAIIERAARKKLRTMAALDPATQRRRLFAYLARRGYEIDDIRRTMTALLDKPMSEQVRE